MAMTVEYQPNSVIPGQRQQLIGVAERGHQVGVFFVPRFRRHRLTKMVMHHEQPSGVRRSIESLDQLLALAGADASGGVDAGGPGGPVLPLTPVVDCRPPHAVDEKDLESTHGLDPGKRSPTLDNSIDTSRLFDVVISWNPEHRNIDGIDGRKRRIDALVIIRQLDEITTVDDHVRPQALESLEPAPHLRPTPGARSLSQMRIAEMADANRPIGLELGIEGLRIVFGEPFADLPVVDSLDSHSHPPRQVVD